VALAAPFITLWMLPVVYWFGDRDRRGRVHEWVQALSFLFRSGALKRHRPKMYEELEKSGDFTSTTWGHEAWPHLKPVLRRALEMRADRAGGLVELDSAGDPAPRSEHAV